MKTSTLVLVEVVLVLLVAGVKGKTGHGLKRTSEPSNADSPKPENSGQTDGTSASSLPSGLRDLGAASVLIRGVPGIPLVQTVRVLRPVPVPVTVHRPVPVAVPQPYPVAVPRPYPVAVPHPVAVHVPRPYPVSVPRPVPVAVPHPVPVGVPVPRPYAVPVPVPLYGQSGPAGFPHSTGYSAEFAQAVLRELSSSGAQRPPGHHHYGH